MKTTRLWIVLMGLLLGSMAQSAGAHGLGKQRLERAEAGPFRVTAWTDPVTIHVEDELHVTIAVEDNEGLVLDADLIVTAVKNSKRISAKATHDRAANKLHYEAPLVFDQTGEWEIVITVENEDGSGIIGFTIDAEAKQSRPPYLWIAGAIVGLLVIGLIVRNRVRHL
ncbi:MAG: hypothetical protein H6673_09115 [Anaerolineales bacterium]|nr:hypothetical protein [Anaerolineales bacterium]